jgi:hypothetical protein
LAVVVALTLIVASVGDGTPTPENKPADRLPAGDRDPFVSVSGQRHGVANDAILVKVETAIGRWATANTGICTLTETGHVARQQPVARAHICCRARNAGSGDVQRRHRTDAVARVIVR